LPFNQEPSVIRGAEQRTAQFPASATSSKFEQSNLDDEPKAPRAPSTVSGSSLTSQSKRNISVDDDEKPGNVSAFPIPKMPNEKKFTTGQKNENQTPKALGNTSGSAAPFLMGLATAAAATTTPPNLFGTTDSSTFQKPLFGTTISGSSASISTDNTSIQPIDTPKTPIDQSGKETTLKLPGSFFKNSQQLSMSSLDINTNAPQTQGPNPMFTVPIQPGASGTSTPSTTSSSFSSTASATSPATPINTSPIFSGTGVSQSRPFASPFQQPPPSTAFNPTGPTFAHPQGPITNSLFGQPAFGQTMKFGQPGFATPSFGQPGFSNQSIPAPQPTQSYAPLPTTGKIFGQGLAGPAQPTGFAAAIGQQPTSFGSSSVSAFGNVAQQGGQTGYGVSGFGLAPSPQFANNPAFTAMRDGKKKEDK